MIRFALIGAGFIGSVHARNLARHELVDFALVADVNQARAKAVADTCGARVAAVEEVFASNVDALLIASSTNTHAEYLERAAAAKKAAYCEKPIELNLTRARVAHDIVKKSGIPCMIGFNRRFDESHAAVKEAVDRGDIGKVELVQLTNRGPTVPPIEYVKVSGGQMHDQAIHFFDMVRFLTNDDPTELYAVGAALANSDLIDVGDVDTSVVTLCMRSGAFCQIDSIRRTAYGYDERVEVFGAEGVAESARQQYRHMSLYKGRTITSDGFHSGWFERVEPTYFRALDAFVRALQGEKTAYPTLDDGLKAQIIADAATESLKTRRPVTITY